MTWHYALLRKHKRINGKLYRHYEVVEVYDEKSWSAEPEKMVADSPKEMIEILSMVITDICRYPVYEIKEGKLSRKTNERGE